MPRVRSRRVCRGACLALWAASWAGPASASPATTESAPLSLQWTAPRECPQGEAVRTWLAEHLGAAADPAGYPGVTSAGTLAREGAGWRLRLVITRAGTRGEKTLRGRDCEELARSGALALAIALEPELAPGGATEVPAPEGPGRGTETAEPPETDGPVTEPPAGVQVPAPPQPGGADPAGDEGRPGAASESRAGSGAPGPGAASESRAGSGPGPGGAREIAPGTGESAPLAGDSRASGQVPGGEVSENAPRAGGELVPLAGEGRARPRVAVGHALRLAAGLELGALPGVGAGLTGAYALRLRWLRVELTGSWWPGRRREYAEPAGVGARAQVGAAGLRVCPTIRVRRPSRAGVGLVELPLCAGLELGALVVRGVGFAGAQTVRTLWAAAELQPGVAWRFTRRLALWAALGLVVPITRESFAVDPLPELFGIGPAGLRAAVGLEVHLGREKN